MLGILGEIFFGKMRLTYGYVQPVFRMKGKLICVCVELIESRRNFF